MLLHFFLLDVINRKKTSNEKDRNYFSYFFSKQKREKNTNESILETITF